MSSISVGTPGLISQPPAQASYLGQGIAYPPTFNPNTGRLMLSSGNQSVADALTGLLQTQPGERAMQPDFGADKGTFDTISPSQYKIALEEQIVTHEPRVQSTDVQIDFGQSPSEQQTTIRYQIIGQANQQTLTAPFFTGP